MPKLMDKNDWIQAVANVSAAERVWSEQISTDDGVFSMPGLESGTYQVIFVKILSPSRLRLNESRRMLVLDGVRE